MNPGFDINSLAGCSNINESNVTSGVVHGFPLPGPGPGSGPPTGPLPSSVPPSPNPTPSLGQQQPPLAIPPQQQQSMGTMGGSTMSVPTNVLNTWASSVNLSSIQSLVDVLLELPLPSEIELPSQNQPLISAIQEQQHLSNNIEQELVQQHHLSRQLSSCLLQARQQLNELNINWINSPVNEGNQEFSQNLQVNSYLLSLLQRQDIFGEDVRLPPVIHAQPSVSSCVPPSQPQQHPQTSHHHQQQQYQNPIQQHAPQQQQPLLLPPPTPPTPSAQSGPQTRSHSNAYWNPFINEQQSAQSPAAGGPSQQQPYNRHPNQMYSNENSNSSGSFPDIGAAAPGTPSAPPNHNSAKVRNQSYNEMTGKHNQGSVLESPDLNNTSSYSPTSFESFTSLGERVKKRQRNNLPPPTPPPPPPPINSTPVKTPSSSTSTPPSSSVQSEKSSHHNEELITPPPRKLSKSSSSANVKSSNVKSFNTMSTSSSSTSSRLISSMSSAPAPEKFESMLDELFDVDNGNKPTASSDESSDSEDDKRKRKTHKKTNGDNSSSNKSLLFDITLSSTTLTTLVCLAAKLKRINAMKNIPVEKLGKLLNVLNQQLAIQSAGLKDKRRKSTDTGDANDEDDEEESIANSASLMSKFEMCCDCCLLALYIMTSKGMSSRVYLEECIEHIIAFLNTTIQQYTTIGGAQTMFTSPKKGGKSPKKLSNSCVSPFSSANKKLLYKMYVKWSELIGCLVELLNARAGTLTDTLVLSATRVALGAFFLENLNASGSNQSSNEIQLNALHLTTAIFSQYQAHRPVILEEILHSIARVSTNKRSRVQYKVESDDKSAAYISMFSALLLRLIQSLFIPEKKKENKTSEINESGDSKDKEKEKAIDKSKEKQDQSQILRKQYDSAILTALSFLTTFQKKCHGASGGGSASSNDADFRVIFENLVNDLMVTLFKPNWPASQLLTKVLIKMFLNNIVATTNKSPAKGGGSGGMSANLNMKLTSLDHLGNICSRYAKELSEIEEVKLDVQSRLRNLLSGGDIECNTRQNNNDEEDEDAAKSDEEVNNSGDDETRKTPSKSKNKDKKKKRREDRLLNDNILVREMWKHLFRYCDEEKLIEEKNLFIASLIKETDREMELAIKDDEKNEEDKIRDNFNLRVKKFMDIVRTASNHNASEEEYHVIDSKTAEQIIRYLDNTFTSTEKLFDVALAHIVGALSGTSNTTMRSRAMKALSTILNNAPKERATALLSRPDVQRATRAALLDTSTSVREATIDLIGKFILNGQSEELIDKYYETLTERILDAGVSVRKRVITILRKICINYPSYKRVPEICSKIIKRINDDGEGIRKLVTETFTTMWFKDERNKEAAKMKVKCINHVVATVITERIGTEWLQQLLTNLFSSGPDGKSKKNSMDDDDDEKTTPTAAQLQQVIAASAQIVDVLVSDVLCGSNYDDSQASLDNNSKSTCFATMTTIWLFSKVCPQLLVNHISTLQPYLSVKITSELDSLILIKAVQTIEHVLPKLTNPSDLLLSSIEEGLTKIILQSNPQVLVVCVSCLSSLIHKHTNNKQLAQDLFKRFYSLLDSLYRLPQSDFNSHMNRPRLLRALFTCGLFAKHFEFLAEKEQLYHLFVQFVTRNMPSEENGYRVGDLAIINNALSGLGFMFERNPAYTLKTKTQETYKTILSAALNCSDCKSLETYYESTMISVLKNLNNYLSDELNAEIAATLDWSKENLKTMSYEDSEGDSNSIQSSIIQTYLPDIVKCTLCPLTSVRKAAVNLIHIIHRGGIVHPLQLVPYLIAMSSDDDTSIRSRADHVLHEIERKYHGFVSMKARQGVQLSFQLHNFSGRRGFRIENIMQSTPANASSSNSSSPGSANQPAPEDQLITGRLSTLYSVIASNRQSRRAFITGLLKYFDLVAEPHSFFTYDPMSVGIINLFDGNNDGIDLVPLQQYVSDNLIWLPYSVLDEPLYILSQLELNISVSSSQIQSQFTDLLNLSNDYDEEEEEANQKYSKKEHQPEVVKVSGENGKNDEDEEDETNNEKLNSSLDMKMDISMASSGCDTDMKQDNSSTPELRAENGFVESKPVSSKDFISSSSVAALIRCLKAFYMLCWGKQMIRELFNITDAKFQDYSPSENQKVWDKQMHRRHVDPRLLEKLMAYPTVNITLENFTREAILEEYQRFKNLQLTGFDETCKNVAVLLKEPLPRDKKDKEKAKSSRNNRNRFEESEDEEDEDEEEEEEPIMEEPEEKIPVVPSHNHEPNLAFPKFSEEEKEKLIEQMKMSNCHVKLIDINTSINSNQIAMNSHDTDESDARSGLRMTINTSSMNSHGVDRNRSSSKKKKKKHKKYSD